MEDKNRSFWLFALDGKLSSMQDMLETHAGGKIDIHWKNPKYDDSSALVIAAWAGHLDVVQWLLEKDKTKVDDKDSKGFTPTIWAARHGCSEMLRLLIDHGGCMNEQTDEGNTALSLACMYGHEQAVQILIDHGADLNTRNKQGRSVLISASASKSENLVILRALIDARVDVNAQDIKGRTPLMHACIEGNRRIALELLNHGATQSINVQDEDGDSPLMMVSKNGHWLLARDLVAEGADVRLRNNKGFSALLLAAADGRDECVQVLVDCGADVNDHTPGGRTPLILACKEGHAKVVRKLLLQGAEATINVRDEELGNTALIWAARRIHKEVITWLLDYSADVSIRNKQGETAPEVASSETLSELRCYSPLVNDFEELWIRMDSKAQVSFGALWYRALKVRYDERMEKERVANWLQAVGALPVETIHNALKLVEPENDDIGLHEFAGLMRCVALAECGEPLDRNVIMNVRRRLFPRHAAFSFDMSYTRAFSKNALFGKLQLLQQLYAEHSDEIIINWRNPFQYESTPLIEAAFSDSDETILWMVDHLGLWVNEQNSNGNAALHCTCTSEKVVEMLLDHGASIDLRNNLGETPLMRAARWGYEGAVRVLLRRGADDLIKDAEGRTASDWAERNGRTGCLAILSTHAARRSASQSQSRAIYSRMFYRLASEGRLVELKEFYDRNKDGINVKWAHPEVGNTALSIATLDNANHETVRWLLMHTNTDVNQCNNRGSAALHNAARQGNDKIVQILLELGANVNMKMTYGWTSLHLAAFNNHDRVVQILLDHNGDPRIEDDDGEVAIESATEYGCFRCVDALKDRYTDAFEKVFFGYAKNGKLGLLKQWYESHNEKNDIDWKRNGSFDISPLIKAISRGHFDVAIWLIENTPVDLDSETEDGETAAILAAERDDAPLLQLILEKGACFDHESSYKALRAATSNVPSSCVAILLSHGLVSCNNNEKDPFYCALVSTCFSMLVRNPEVNQIHAFYEQHKNSICVNERLLGGTRPPLIEATLSNRADIVRWLLNTTDVNVNLPNEDGNCALHYAKSCEIAEALLDHGADIHAIGRRQMTLLHHAAARGDSPIASLLIQRGVDLECMSTNRWTALLYSADSGPCVVPLLVEYGANVNHQSTMGSTALKLAIDQGHETTVDVLLQHHANPNLADNQGNTPLHFVALSTKFLQIAPLLLSYGANFHSRNHKGQTALMEANRARNDDASSHLLVLETTWNPFHHFQFT